MLGVLVAGAPTLAALTLEELMESQGMTPKRFAGYFEEFDYEFSPEVLPADLFLRQRKGDCDDYAILADHVLRKHNFETKLIHVRMVGRVAHAVCYVTQGGVYLDFNNRKFFFNLQKCGRSIREIASKVADSFEANWTSASEFTYDYVSGQKKFGITVVKTDPPSSDPDRAPAAARN